jgi:PknH-like extracellular domain
VKVPEIRRVAGILCSPTIVWAQLALSGCTQVVDTPTPTAAPPVAPITAGQVDDLLSPKVQQGDGNLFVTVEPEQCSGVAKEVDPPFIFDPDPAATGGGHWMVDDGREVYIEEMVGVYRADYDAKSALSQAKQALQDCEDVPFTVTDMKGRSYDFTLLPAVASPSPDILLWSFRAKDWACDSAFVAAHNAAIEISTCGPVGGYPVNTLAADALKRIETLANTTA